MPLNESKSFPRSNLTKEQKQEQLAVLYGLQKGSSMSLLDQLSPAERAQLIAEVKDAINAPQAPPREFDLNNPPKVDYKHQEYPRMVYHAESRGTALVHSDEELASALEQGYSKEPFPAEVPEVELSAADAAEAADVDRRLRKRKGQ